MDTTGAKLLRLTLVTYTLALGGAERVLSILANAWAERGDRVAVAALSHAGEPAFTLHPSIPLRIVGAPGRVTGGLEKLTSLARLSAIRRALGQPIPDAVIAFGDASSILATFAALGSKIPVIAMETHDPALDGRLVRSCRRLAYPLAARVVVLTERMLEGLPSAIRRRSAVIPNPVIVPPPPSAEGVASVLPRGTIVSVGRMVDEKGFDVLIEAFARIADRHPAWSLVLWGEGPRKATLEALRDRLGLTARVRLPGRTTDAYRELRSADLYVLSSRSEGFPMALCEAMASGLPVVAFDCRTGPREIIRDSVDGVLVSPGDVDALARAMDRLLGDEVERFRLAARAPEVTERFSLSRVLDMWDDLLSGVVRLGPRSC
jgi:glycosyltransferase involved in cell wall biosynthesis